MSRPLHHDHGNKITKPTFNTDMRDRSHRPAPEPIYISHMHIIESITTQRRLCYHYWNTRYATLAPNKIFYRAPKIMLLEIDHVIGFTTRRAVTTAEVELVMRVADLPGRLLLALPISREQRRPVNGDLPRTAPRGSLERFVLAPQIRCLQGIHTYGEQRRAADC